MDKGFMYPYFITLIIFSRNRLFLPSLLAIYWFTRRLIECRAKNLSMPNLIQKSSSLNCFRDTVIVMSNHDGKIMNTCFQCCCLLATNTTILIKSNGDIESRLCRELQSNEIYQQHFSARCAIINPPTIIVGQVCTITVRGQSARHWFPRSL